MRQLHLVMLDLPPEVTEESCKEIKSRWEGRLKFLTESQKETDHLLTFLSKHLKGIERDKKRCIEMIRSL